MAFIAAGIEVGTQPHAKPATVLAREFVITINHCVPPSPNTPYAPAVLCDQRRRVEAFDAPAQVLAARPESAGRPGSTRTLAGKASIDAAAFTSRFAAGTTDFLLHGHLPRCGAGCLSRGATRCDHEHYDRYRCG